MHVGACERYFVTVVLGTRIRPSRRVITSYRLQTHYVFGRKYDPLAYSQTTEIYITRDILVCITERLRHGPKYVARTVLVTKSKTTGRNNLSY